MRLIRRPKASTPSPRGLTPCCSSYARILNFQQFVLDGLSAGHGAFRRGAMQHLKMGLWLVLLTACSAVFGAEHRELKTFPEAKEGMERFVIVLPDKARGE